MSERAFAAWIAFVIPEEGGLSLDPDDPGNWTSGIVGQGKLLGTKYGVACSSHPGVDIANLTRADAVQRARIEFWEPLGCDRLPDPIAVLLQEAAWGSGPDTAKRQLQQALAVQQDGVLGPRTMKALATAVTASSSYGLASGLDDLMAEFISVRMLFLTELRNWSEVRTGWTRRLARGLILACSVKDQSRATA